MSISWGKAASKMAFARATFSAGLPSLGLNCRQAIRILQRKSAGTVGMKETPGRTCTRKDCNVTESLKSKMHEL